jgi:DNA-binding CsgD family transcriptional regulator/tetratricopeptide (TPR) repeat protein
MTWHPPHVIELIGRRRECAALDRVLGDGRAGQSQVLVLRGEAGSGKSALLEYISQAAAGWRVATVVGVESEMELAYSGLHQLLGSMHDQLEQLPLPQRDAVSIIFGRSTGPPPDPFLVGLATLTLFAEAAEQEPLLCVVDDAHWLDSASGQILGFVARRLYAERVAIVCAARTGSGDAVLAGLPELMVRGLGDSDARALLLKNIHGPLDAAICDRIVAESHGNPLALLELPRTWSAAELAGGYGIADAQALRGKIEGSFIRRFETLPAKTRSLLLLAAAEPVGDPLLVRQAAERSGIEPADATVSGIEQLLNVGERVTFRHPLVRSAVYGAASRSERQAAHLVLSEVTNGESHPDRRAWHLAAAASGPDENVAEELERSASLAQARGGLAAAAAFLQRSVALSSDPGRRARRALAAAQANLQAGAFPAALDLLDTAEAGSLDDLARARVDLLRGQIAFASGLGSQAPPLLLKAAKRIEALDPDLARETYLDAWIAALFAGRLAGVGDLLEVSRAARSAPEPSGPPRLHDLLLEGFSVLITDGPAAAAPLLRRTAHAFTDGEGEAGEELRWGWLGPAVANQLWDSESWKAILDRQVQLARNAGALTRLSIDLNSLAVYAVWTGDLRGAKSLIAELNGVTEATGATLGPFATVMLAAFEGLEDTTSALIKEMLADSTSMGQGVGVTWAHWVDAIHLNASGRYDEALAAAQRASDEMPQLYFSAWALPEVVEAASRTKNNEVGERYLERLIETTEAAGTDWGLGVQARARAMLAAGERAEALYRDANERLGRTRLLPEVARTQLVYGEWLRREGRRLEARAQLRTAHDTFVAIGMGAFAERARHELLATGEKVRARSDETRGQLTPQEEQIARLARDGLSNPEIGSQLFLSPRTIEWHLHKVFGKLGITSRGALRAALPKSA